MTTEHDLDRFNAIIHDMNELLAPKEPLTSTVVRLMWNALKDLPIEDVEYRCNEWMKVGKYFPTPGHLREIPERKLRGYPLLLGMTVPCEVCRQPFLPPRYDDGSAMRIFTCAECQKNPKPPHKVPGEFAKLIAETAERIRLRDQAKFTKGA